MAIRRSYNGKKTKVLVVAQGKKVGGRKEEVKQAEGKPLDL